MYNDNVERKYCKYIIGNKLLVDLIQLNIVESYMGQLI